MTTLEIVVTILCGLGGVCTAILGYFLKRTMNQLDKTTAIAVEAEKELALIKLGFGLKVDRLEEKFDELKDAVIGLTDEMRMSREQSFKQHQ